MYGGVGHGEESALSVAQSAARSGDIRIVQILPLVANAPRGIESGRDAEGANNR